MGTPLASREAQATEVVDRLHEEYPDSTISLNYSNRLELLIAVVLSAQCTDERVNEVTAELFEKYDSPEDYAAASEEQLAEDIYGITFHNNKGGYLKGIGEQIVAEHDGEVPDTMSALTDLPGVGRKTANVVLQHGHDIVEGIVVDTHVQRLSRRLGLTEEERPEAIEQDLLDIVPESEWQQFTHLLIDHGRAVCGARSAACGDCTLADICPSEEGDSGIDLATGEPWCLRVHADRQDGDVRRADDLLGDAAQQIAVHARPAVGPHHDEVGVVLLAVVEDSLVGVATEDHRLDGDIVTERLGDLSDDLLSVCFDRTQFVVFDVGHARLDVLVVTLAGHVGLRDVLVVGVDHPGRPEVLLGDEQDVQRRAVLRGYVPGMFQCRVGTVTTVRRKEDCIVHGNTCRTTPARNVNLGVSYHTQRTYRRRYRTTPTM